MPSEADKELLLRVAQAVCHEEQMTVWSSDFAGALSMNNLLRDLSYDEVVELHQTIQLELQRIVASAMQHPEAARVLREAAEGWIFDVASIPRDDTVLVCVEPTEKNNTRKRDRSVLPAYVDEDGRFCDSGTWKPDPGLQGEYWRTVAWRRFPLPPPPSEAATLSQETRNDD